MKENALPVNFYSGTSGLVLPIPKYLFPEMHQNSSRLTYYSTLLNSIEINTSFYKLPLPRTIRKWNEQVPDNFKFTFKLWQGITHTEELYFKDEDVKSFFHAVAEVDSKKGCILIQFPPSIKFTKIRQLDALLSCIANYNTNKEWKIAVEFRNNSWYDYETYDLLESHNAALVLQDIPKSKSPMITNTADFIYLRFHGPSGNYKDSYTEEFLSDYAALTKDWLKEGKTVYAYFNNTIGDAFRNLESFNNFVYS